MKNQSNLSRIQINHISGEIINSAIKVHSRLGPGLLESAYEKCLIHELEKTGMDLKSQTVLPVYYDEIRIDLGYRADLVVENSILVELKSVEKISALYIAQLLTYLRLSNFQLGLIINFNVLRLTDGLRWLTYDP